jgi:hypothetical protein
MATTTNFGFETPDDTDLVKDGALAMRTLGNNIDARFGNVTTYPNQIVNVVSGVSRPLPYAFNAQTGTSASIAGGGTGTVVFTLPAGRFTQSPIVTYASNVGSTGTAFSYRTTISGTSSVSVQIHNGTGTAYVFTIYIMAVQMTSAAAAG